MSIRRFVCAGALTLAGLLGGGSYLAAPGFAFEGYTLRARLGGEGSGDGQFKGPVGVAVNDTTDDLYVADSANNRVQELTPEGAYVTQFSGGPEHTFSDPTYVAVDNSAGPAKGDVYVVDSGHVAVDVFSEDGKYLRQLPIGGPVFGGVMGVTVDSSGNVWVALGNPLVEEFNDAGTFVTQFRPEFEDSSYGNVPGIAVDSQGSIYLEGRSEGVLKFNASFEGLYEVVGANDASAFAVAPASGDLFFDQGAPRFGHPRITECEPFAEPASAPCEVDVFGELEGLSDSLGIAVDGSGVVFASEYAADKVSVFKFVLLGDVGTGPPSAVGRMSATVTGTVKRDGKPASYSVQYGEGQSLTSSTTPVAIPGETEEEVSVELAELKVATTYSYRLIVENENGINYGQVKTLTTLPAVEGVSTGPVENVTATTARLTGTLEPNGYDTHYHFQYGESTGYGLLSPSLPGIDAGSEHEVVPAATGLSELVPDTTYHYRLVGENTFGATSGQDATFTTLPVAPRASVLPASLVSPVSAVLNATVDPEHSGDTHAQIVFGATTGYGTSLPAQEEVDVGAGYGGQLVSQTVEGLQPGTTYHYAVIASNPQGSVKSPDATFTTPPVTVPVVLSGPASAVTQTTAILSGTVDPRGVPTRYEFDLGTDTTYGSRVFGDAGSGSEEQTFTLALQDLMPGTTYHYRIAASNVYGVSYGADQTFTTPGFPTTLIPVPLTAVLVPSPVFQPFSTASASEPTGKARAKKPAKKPKSRKQAKRRSKRAGKRAALKATRLTGRHGKGGVR